MENNLVLKKTNENYWNNRIQEEFPDYSILRGKKSVSEKSLNKFSTTLSESTITKIKNNFAKSDIAYFTFITGIVNTLLLRYTQASNQLIATGTLALKPTDKADSTLLLISSLENCTTFKDLLNSTKEAVLEGYKHQDVAIEKLLENKKITYPEFTIYYEAIQKTPAFTSELTIVFGKANDITLHYSNCYTNEFVERLALHLNAIFEAVSETIDIQIAQIEYLTTLEKEELLNRGATHTEKQKNILTLLEEQAAKTPDNIAFACENNSLTFSEAVLHIQQQSGWLAAQGVKKGDVVAALISRTEKMPTALLSILKTGATYLPIDTEYPADRIGYILEDSNASYLFTEKEIELPAFKGKILYTEDCTATEKTTNNSELEPELPAYIIYTSGSTGKPKGVTVTHGNLANFLENIGTINACSITDTMPFIASSAFDISFFEMFNTVLKGGKTIVVKKEAVLDWAKNSALLKQVTVIHAVPALMRQMIDIALETGENYDHIKEVYVGGDLVPLQLPHDIKKVFKKAQVKILYGPTEASIFCTVKNVDTTSQLTAHLIGKPIENVQLYVLDKYSKLLPKGIPGELCIGGKGVSKGYINREELNREKFIDNPYCEGEKLYKTGDLGRWNENNELEFEGRIDNQVKIRGFRIELGEIENVLQKADEIKEAVVIAIETEDKTKALCAYYVADKELSPDELKNYLLKTLPEYMVPAYYVRIEKIPLTPNKKIDRKALPHPASGGSRKQPYAAPQTELQTQLVSIWEELLGVEKIGINDNFFELGGHSLRAMKLVAQLHKVLGLKVELRDVFTHDTIQKLSEQMSSASASTAYEEIPALPEQESYALSRGQRRIWIVSQIENVSVAYNHHVLFYLDGSLNTDALEKAYHTLVERHESLRTIFVEKNESPVQIILPADSDLFVLRKIDLSAGKNAEKELKEISEKEAQQSFDLQKGPLLRVVLAKVADNKHVLLFTIHHLISDGNTLEIMIREIQQLYFAYSKGEKNPLAPLRIQYKDFAAWQNKQLEGNTLEEHRAFWLNKFSGELPVLQLPLEKPRPAVQTFNGDKIHTAIEKTIFTALKKNCLDNNNTLFMAFMGAVNILLSKYSGQTDIIIGSPIAGREHADLENQLGLYMNILPYRTTFSTQNTVSELLEIIKNDTLSTFRHQVYPFDQLVDELKLERDLSRSPLFDVSITFQNTQQAKQITYESDIKFYGAPSAHTVSKYDITFVFVEGEEGLSVEIEYNTDLFSAQRITQMGNHLKNIFAEISKDTGRKIAEIDYLSAEEKEQLVHEFNNTALAINTKASIVSLIEEQVQKQGNKTALFYKNNSVSYAELNEKANQLANILRSKGAKPDTLVGVYMDRSAEMLIAMLAILKSGAAYLPLDPSFPAERIAYMLADSKAALVITDNKEITFDGELISLQKEEKNIAQLSALDADIKPKPEHLAYVIYTSGSTGKPKGVMVEHAQAVNFFEAMNREIPLSSDSVFLAVTTISFDISVLELLWTLSKGCSVVIQPDKTDLFAVTNTAVASVKKLEFSLFYFANAEEDGGNKYKLLIEGAKFADKNGFSAVWTPERHFHEFGGLYPNPSITSAAVASITKNIKIRSGSVVVPLHNPIRIAEEWSVVDNISNGRIGLSFASGWNINDFVLSTTPDAYKNRHKVMYEGIETIQKLWRGESVELSNEQGHKTSVKIYPKPIQKEFPFWLTAAGNPETFRMAGEKGANLLTHLLGQSVDELEHKIKVYRDAWRAAGHPGNGHVTLMVHTFIGENKDEVKQIVKQPFINYLKTSLGLVQVFAKALGMNMDGNNMSDADMQTLLEYSFERYYETATILGTADSCFEFVNKLRRTGVDELGCLVDFGIPAEIAVKGLQHLNVLKKKIDATTDASGFSLSENIKRHGVTHLQCTPSMAKLLMSDDATVENMQAIKHLLIGGEAVSEELKNTLTSTLRGEVHNMYGPTETTVWSCTEVLKKENKVSIGKPVANTEIYILDQDKNQVAIGVEGEIYIGGKGVTRGYWERTELTAERYIQHTALNKRLYRTGDIGRWNADGKITYLRRNDEQVKVRGYRIELGEIESKLRQLPDVKEAVVIVKGDTDKYLAAFVESTAKINEGILREQLLTQLPEYMIPNFITVLEKLPLTANGKINRKELQNAENKISATGNYEKPANETEEKIAIVWQQLLGAKQISVTDSFFSLGGDSIKAIQAVSRMRQSGLTVEVRDLFNHPTVRKLAKVVKTGVEISDQKTVAGIVPLTPIQHWFFETYPGGEKHYNHVILLNLEQALEVQTIEKIIRKIQLQHDALRIRYRFENGNIVQENIGEEYPVHVVEKDLRNEKDASAALEKYSQQIQQSISLEAGPLMHIVYFRMPTADKLLIVIHHLVIDGISWRILFEDLNKGLEDARQQKEIELPLKTDSFKKWAEKLTDYGKNETILRHSAYWKKIITEQVPKLPVDFESAKNPVKESASLNFSLSAEHTSLLLKDAQKPFHTDINDFLLTALAMSISKFHKGNKTLISLEGHGREAVIEGIDISRTVGWFTSMYPVLLELPHSTDLSYKLRYIKETLRTIPDKGISYGILNYLTDALGKEKTNKPEILFNYLGQFDADLDNKSFDVGSESTGPTMNPDSERAFTLEISGAVAQGKLNMSIRYCKKQYKEESILQLTENFKQALVQLIEECTRTQSTHFTPNDFAYRDLIVQDFPLSVFDETITETENINYIYPLSPLQEGMLYHYRYDPNSEMNFHQVQYTLQGKLNIPVFEQCWNELMKRHDILRSQFVYDGVTRPLQIIHKKRTIEFVYKDIKHLAKNEQNVFIENYKKEDKKRGIKLSKDVLLRIAVLQLSENSYEVVWSYHHIILDGWCIGILMGEIGKMYEALSRNVTPQLGEVKGYGEYIYWLEKQNKAEAKNYWKKYLSGYESITNIPSLREVKETRYQLASHTYKLSDKHTSALQNIAKQNNITLNSVLHGVWSILLSKYNYTDDVVFGTTIAGRPAQIEGVENIIGLFINTIPVRVKLEKDISFEGLIKNINDNMVEGQNYQNYSLADIQTLSESKQVLFDHILVFNNFAANAGEESGAENNSALQVQNIDVFEQTHYNLTVEFLPQKNLSIKFGYNALVLNEKIIKKLGIYFSEIVKEISAATQKKVGDINYIPKEEYLQLTETYNNTGTEYPRNKTLHYLFEQQAAKTPDKTALTLAGKKISYKELNEKANSIANTLINKGVKTNAVVGILADRSAEMIAGLLGILKAGAAYLPLDPTVPSQRLAFMLKDTNAKILLTHTENSSPEFEGETLSIESCINTAQTNNPSVKVSAEDLAYIIFTSGSTGNPKGTLIPHKAVSRVVLNTNYIEINSEDIILQLSNYAFDGFTFDMYAALLNGATLYITDKESVKDTHIVSELIASEKITVFFTTTALFNTFVTTAPDKLKNVRKILFGGEKISVPHVKKALEYVSKDTLVHVYGPTECTVFATYYPIREVAADAVTIPIGKPISNTEYFILSKNNIPVADGAVGELALGGEGLSGGYLNNEALTQEKFIPHPFKENEKIYKTGDLVYTDASGNIVYLDRIDQQVKIRGYRIELPEIENQLRRVKGIQETSVIVVKDGAGDNRLLAFYVSDKELSDTKIKSEIADYLPAYMLPAFYTRIEKIPLNANGKVDKKALEQIALPEKNKEIEAAVTDTEKALLQLWNNTLGVEKSGITNNFFELGGHSLKAAQLISYIRKELNVDVPMAAFFATPTIKALAAYIDGSAKTQQGRIPQAVKSTHYPLSAAQKRIYLVTQFSNAGIAYNIPGVFELKGKLDVERLKEAFKKLIARHESLRTSFEMINDEPAQIINDKVAFDIEITEVKKSAIEPHIAKFVRPFHLSEAPLLRVGLLKKSATDYILLFDIHHIVSDGTSMGVLVEEILNLYDNNDLAPLSIQYKDYASWQNDLLQQEAMKKKEAFWLKTFDGEIPVLELPYDYKRPALQSYAGEHYQFRLSEQQLSGLKAVAAANGATLYMTLLSAYTILLHKYSGQEDIVVGSPTTGRSHADLQHVVGMFVNTLPLRNYPKGNISYQKYLEEVKNNFLNAMDNQEYQLEELIEKLNIKRDLSRNPLFDTVFTLQNLDNPSVNSRELTFTPYKRDDKISKFDLHIQASENANEVLVDISYATSLFTASTIEQLANHFVAVIDSIVKNPKISISEIEILAPEVKDYLLNQLNDTKTSYPTKETLVTLFEKQVQERGESVALIAGDTEISYRELNERANQLAHCLRKKGVQPNQLVAIMTDRTIEMLVGILAILKSGAAYLPIDPDYPQDRIDYTLEDSCAHLIITQKEYVNKLSASVEIVLSDDTLINTFATTNPDYVNKPSDLAYVIYTSGSTGKPKGVMIEHRNVVRLLFTDKPLFDFSEKDTWTMFHSFCFDFSVWEMYGALLFGGKLVIVPKQVAQNPADFIDLLVKNNVSILNQTPGAFYNLLNEEAERKTKKLKLRYVIFGGEALAPARLKKYNERYPRTQLINMYGITETTVHVTYKVIGKAEIESNVSNIGKPIPTLSVYIFDKYAKLVPTGVTGEMYVGGEGVARGYLNKEQLTSERFIQNPYNKNERLYKSGDLARYLPNGELEYLGRNDFQVKIRGYRIELGEIEKTIDRIKGIQQSVVLALGDTASEKYLCAYIVETEPHNDEELRKHVRTVLPDYMVPSFFIKLPAIPLTSNGKVSVKELPHPAESVLSEKPYTEPATETEKILAEIWSEILGIKNISADANFFSIGGHSLRAAILVSKIQKRFGKNIQFSDIFVHSTIQVLASYIDTLTETAVAILPLQKAEQYEVSFAQLRLWIMDSMNDSGSAFNIPYTLSVKGKLDINKLEKALQAVTDRHESLRTYFVASDGKPYQKIAEKISVQLDVLSVEKGLKGKALDNRINELTASAANHVFDLGKAPLWFLKIIKVSAQQHYLLLNFHHIISDGWSMNVFIKDIMTVYSGNGILSPLEIQYKDFAAWQNNRISESNSVSASFWKNNLSGNLPVITLPEAMPRPERKTMNGTHTAFSFDEKTTTQLKQLALILGVTDFVIVRSILCLWLYRKTGISDLLTGTPSAGRNQEQLQEIIGYFINTIPLRDRLDWNDSISECIQRINTSTLDALRFDEYPFDKMLQDIGYVRDASRSPLFDVGITWQNFEKNDLSSGGAELEIAAVASEFNYAKYDLWLYGSESENCFRFSLEFNTDLFTAETAKLYCTELTELAQQLPDITNDKLISLRKDDTTSSAQSADDNKGFEYEF